MNVSFRMANECPKVGWHHVAVVCYQFSLEAEPSHQ